MKITKLKSLCKYFDLKAKEAYDACNVFDGETTLPPLIFMFET
jgi:hypothetical protein